MYNYIFVLNYILYSNIDCLERIATFRLNILPVFWISIATGQYSTPRQMPRCLKLSCCTEHITREIFQFLGNISTYGYFSLNKRCFKFCCITLTFRGRKATFLTWYQYHTNIFAYTKNIQ